MKKIKTAYLTSAIGCLVVVIGIVCYFLFAGIAKNDGVSYLYIDDDDDMDSVSAKLSDIATPTGVAAVRTMARHMGYADNIRTGRYLLNEDMSALRFFRNLRNGHQEPMRLVMPSVRTKARLAQELGNMMMFRDSDFLKAISDESVCEKYGLDISRAALVSGASIAPYLGSFKTDLFLSADEYDVQEAVNAGFAAGIICSGEELPIDPDKEIDQIRIAFDGDAVIFSEESEEIYKTRGLAAFGEHERALKLFEQAKTVYESDPHTQKHLLGGLYNNMALCCQALGRYDDAFRLYEQAMDAMTEVAYGELEQAITCLNMADAVAGRDGLEAGEGQIFALLDKAYDLLHTPGVPHEGYYAFVCEKCAPTFSYYGYFLTAEDLKRRAEEIYGRMAE